MPSSAWRTISCLVAGLVLACQQAEPPPAAAEAKAEASAQPSPDQATPAAARPGDGCIAVSITYCIP